MSRQERDRKTAKIETVSELIKELWPMPPGWKICVCSRTGGKVYDIERIVVARFEVDQDGRSEGVILIDFEEWEEEVDVETEAQQ